MHGAASVEAYLPGDLGESSLDVELLHEFFAVIVVLEVHSQFVQEQLLICGKPDTS